MDVGKFKSSFGRLTVWITLPPLLIASIGISTYALRLQSDWELERTRVLSVTRPKVVEARESASELMMQFRNSENGTVNSEDELISYLQVAARNMDFTIDSLKVERKTVSANNNIPVLRASIRGAGTISSIKAYIGDVTARHQLLSESSLQISEGSSSIEKDMCKASITFELVLFEPQGGEI